MEDIKLFRDNYQNFKPYQIPKAQLIVSDVALRHRQKSVCIKPYVVRRWGQQEWRKQTRGYAILQHGQQFQACGIYALLLTNARQRAEREGQIAVYDFILRL